jgi:glycosyltransferase involved in cell wall biosynthesis
MTGFFYTEMQKKSNGGTEQCARMLESMLPEDLLSDFQIIPSRVTELQNDKIRVYWVHDLSADPETNHIKDASSRDRFQKIVFCGNWQYNDYLSKLNIPIDQKLAVIDTPIVPIKFEPKSKEEIRLIYTSTPQRGLEILVPVFEKLCEKYDNIYLDVFSSFAIYGWTEADSRFQELFDRCKNHPKIVYHGFASNDTVRQAQQKAHIFAYPSIWQECNSRAMIEAMSAGCVCVHPNLAGLSDTGGSLTTMYQFTQDNNAHANYFYHVLDSAISNVHEDAMQNYLQFVKQYADVRYNANKIADQWKILMLSLKQQYPTIESRSKPKAMFTYRTT